MRKLRRMDGKGWVARNKSTIAFVAGISAFLAAQVGCKNIIKSQAGTDKDAHSHGPRTGYWSEK